MKKIIPNVNAIKIYLHKFSNLLLLNKKNIELILRLIENIKKIKKNKKKIFIVGNGGSAAIASHFSVDLTLNCKIRCYNLNEADLITCFANDFGYENWVAKALSLYGDKGDGLIVVSSSGNSKNMINACKKAKQLKFNNICTFTGFKSQNAIRKLGDQNIWIDNDNYNYVENAHQVLLLMIVDLLKAKKSE